MIVVLDDHLLRDVLASTAPPALLALESSYATTNLYYYRLCKSAASAPRAGRLLGDWSVEQRRALMEQLVALPAHTTIVPIRDLAWRMAMIAADHPGLSALGAEAVAAAEHLEAGLCVAADDDGPGIRRAASALGLSLHAIAR